MQLHPTCNLLLIAVRLFCVSFSELPYAQISHYLIRPREQQVDLKRQRTSSKTAHSLRRQFYRSPPFQYNVSNRNVSSSSLTIFLLAPAVRYAQNESFFGLAWPPVSIESPLYIWSTHRTSRNTLISANYITYLHQDHSHFAQQIPANHSTRWHENNSLFILSQIDIKATHAFLNTKSTCTNIAIIINYHWRGCNGIPTYFLADNGTQLSAHFSQQCEPSSVLKTWEL